jgi:dipeptidase
MTHVPETYAEGNGDMLTYSDNAAFWVFNRVTHFSYLFYDRVIVDIRKKQEEYASKFETFVPAIDVGAMKLYNEDPAKAVQFITEFSHSMANNLVADWRNFGNFLLVKYLDGNMKPEESGKFLRNPYGFPAKPKHIEYPDEWKKVIIEQTGEKFLQPNQ